MGWGIFSGISKDITSDVKKATSYVDDNIVKPAVKKVVEPAKTDITKAVSTTEKSTVSTATVLEHDVSGFKKTTLGKDIKSDVNSITNAIKTNVTTTINNPNKEVTVLKHDATGFVKDVKSAYKTVSNSVYTKDIVSEINKSNTTLNHDLTGFKNYIVKGASGDARYIENGLSGIADWFKQYWIYIVIGIVAVILLIVFVFAKGGGTVL